ncbi:MAG: hypothetical protein SFU83_23500 [Meiothermus sp.]|nr:hypothetical protein [Meiothermus sp.]
MSKLGANRIKILRGEVLYALFLFAMGQDDKPLYPDNPWRLPERSLKLTLEGLHQLPNDDELEGVVRYLSAPGKEYLAVQWSNDGRGGFDWAEITAKGVDLCNGDLADVGVTLLRRSK